MIYATVNNHRAMLFDERRNRAYLSALEAVITPDSVVLDVGAGIGVHGLLAARLGARRVHLVEPEGVVHLAKAIAASNGLGDRIVCHQGRIESVELPERVDVITSVFTGNFLLSEDLLPSLFCARDRHLRPGGAMIPDRARMIAAPVCAPELYEERVGIWSRPHLELDFGAVRPYAANSVSFARSKLAATGTYLAEPQSLLELDFLTASDPTCRAELTFEAKAEGLCHGFAGWFDMRLGENWLSTAPHEARLHWSAAFLPLETPLCLRPGDGITLSLVRLPFDEWHWRVETRDSNQQMSSFRGKVPSPGAWRLQSVDARPHLSPEGQARQFVLSRFDGRHSVADLAAEVAARWPQLGWSAENARREISQMAQSLGLLAPGGVPKE